MQEVQTGSFNHRLCETEALFSWRHPQVSEEPLRRFRPSFWQLPPAVPSSRDNCLLSSISHISARRAAVIHPPCRVWIGLRLRSTFLLGLNDKQDVETQCFDQQQQPIRHLNSLCSLARRLDGLVTHNVTMVYCRLDFGALAVYRLSLLLYWQEILCLGTVWTSLQKVCLALKWTHCSQQIDDVKHVLFIVSEAARRLPCCGF